MRGNGGWNLERVSLIRFDRRLPGVSALYDLGSGCFCFAAVCLG